MEQAAVGLAEGAELLGQLRQGGLTRQVEREHGPLEHCGHPAGVLLSHALRFPYSAVL